MATGLFGKVVAKVVDFLGFDINNSATESPVEIKFPILDSECRSSPTTYPIIKESLNFLLSQP